MNNIRIFLLIIVFLLDINNICYSANNNSNLIDLQISKDWGSFILTGNDGISITRMSTISADKKCLLCVDKFPGMCGQPSIRIAIPMQNSTSSSASMTFDGSIRVDTNNIIDVKVSTTPADGSIMLEILSNHIQEIIKQSTHGNIIRFQLKIPGGEPIYSRFSLNGFTAAYDRITPLCDVLKPIQNKDDGFFELSPTQTQKSLDRNDGVENLPNTDTIDNI